jgi:hypothetical protein
VASSNWKSTDKHDGRGVHLGCFELRLQVGDLRLQRRALGGQHVAFPLEVRFPLRRRCLRIPQPRLRRRVGVAVQL